MVSTKVKVTDSEASPYIEQKGVILCRSGIQYYTYNEVVKALGEPPVKKDLYREYRPANVVVKAQDKCKSLPVTKEHPMEWVDQDNWDKLCGGIVGNDVSVVALEGEAEGEIGLKSDVTFFTRKLHDYYEQYKEVSLGYTCRKHYVENPEEVGYDIILDEITEVNHLAITRAGRGGSQVAVIDSIIGGLKPMRTGIFAYLASKMQKDSKEPYSFGKEVLEAVKNSKGTTEEELAGEMKGVLDSMSELKDCEAKDTLVNVVKDCFDNKEKALSAKDELTSTLDSMWNKAQEESLKAFDSSDEKKDDEKNEDSEAEKKSEDSEEKKDEENKDSSDEDKEKDGCHGNKDSAPEVVTKDDILSVIKDALPDMVQSAVKEVLGIKDTSSSKIEGGVVDSAITGTEDNNSRDYSSFLE